jgi:adenylosuccinate synthase
MPVSIVVGGQFGSEGKGKVALEIRRRARGTVTVIRVGGPNSGHTAYDWQGRRWALRQLPAAAVDRDTDVVFPAGSYLDPVILEAELENLAFPKERVFISPFASIISQEHRDWEVASGLVQSIGSTGSGVGAAVLARSARDTRALGLRHIEAREFAPLHRFIADTSDLLRMRLSKGERVIIEGTQGFGLSLLDGGYWPKATARTTSASGALAEAGLSPTDVDDVTLVLRSFPIRVAGDSGPLRDELTWADVAKISGTTRDIAEYTTVTRKIRRVGAFDPSLVRRALTSNAPTRVVLNHVDYIGEPDQVGRRGTPVDEFVHSVSTQIGRAINWLGFDGLGVVEFADVER